MGAGGLEPISGRGQAVRELAGRITTLQLAHTVRIGIDGRSASGKTTLADELASALSAAGRDTVRACLDDFHRPPRQRYRQGRMSPKGYYEDTFDYSALRQLLLEPLGLGGNPSYSRGSMGQPDGSPASFTQQEAQPDSVLLLDGVFLFRPEINARFDFRVFVDVSEDLGLERGVARDKSWMGSEKRARELYAKRYLPGERLYFAAVRPLDLADVVFENSDPSDPVVKFSR